MQRMRLGRACCSAAAVTSRSAAKQDNYISRCGTLTPYVAFGSSTDDSAYLHSLCNVAGVEYLIYHACCQTYLVAIGRIAVGCADNYLSLRQLACDSILNGNERIACACHTHSLINVASSRKRISDSTAETGCSAAERLYLCRVVVGFVFEHQKPVFFVSVNVHLDLYRAGVDLLTLVEVFHKACFFELFCADAGKVHKSYRLVCPACIEIFSGVDVICECISYIIRMNVYVVYRCKESCVAAVIRPVGVYHSDLCDSRVALFGITEIVTAEAYIVKIHSKTQLVEHCLEVVVCRIDKAVNRLYGRRDIVFDVQCLEGIKACLSGFNGVYHIALYLGYLLVRKVARNYVDPCGLDNRALSSRQQGDTLCAGIRTLVELSRQILNSEYELVVLYLRQVVIGDIDRRLGEHNGCCECKILL